MTPLTTVLQALLQVLDYIFFFPRHCRRWVHREIFGTSIRRERWS